MMNITRPIPATLSLVGRQAPARFVFSLLVTLLLLVSAVYMLQVYDCVMSSRRLDMVWPTVATLVAIVIYGVLEQARRLMLGRVSSWLHSELGGPLVRRAMQARIAGWSPSGPNWRPRGHRHRDSSPQASSKRFRLSISPR